jgi:hypothetical protein
VSLLYFGHPDELSSVLLGGLHVLEFRPASEAFSGLFLLENRFGKETYRKLSLNYSPDEKDDWLIYRYLSEEEMRLIAGDRGARRVYILLQNYVTLEYFSGLNIEDRGSCYFLAGNADSHLKKYNYVSARLKTKNLFVVKSFKPKRKEADEKTAGSALPYFMVLLLKLLLNPVDELGRQSNLLMHSNRRVLSRFLELVQFLHYVVKMSAVFVYTALGIRLFWKAVKVNYFIRHVLLMSLYKTWGVLVDTANFLIRVKDGLVGTVYYKFLHRWIHSIWLRLLSPAVFGMFFVFGKLWETVLSPLYFASFHKLYHRFKLLMAAVLNVLRAVYYSTVHRFYFQSLVVLRYRVWPWAKYHIFIKTHHFFVFKVRHFFLMVLYKSYGLVFDLVMLTARITKLYLMYPFFKVFWFTRFQFNKRIKKYFA